jgi:hypothetical protein
LFILLFLVFLREFIEFLVEFLLEPRICSYCNRGVEEDGLVEKWVYWTVEEEGSGDGWVECEVDGLEWMRMDWPVDGSFLLYHFGGVLARRRGAEEDGWLLFCLFLIFCLFVPYKPLLAVFCRVQLACSPRWFPPFLVSWT